MARAEVVASACKWFDFMDNVERSIVCLTVREALRADTWTSSADAL